MHKTALPCNIMQAAVCRVRAIRYWLQRLMLNNNVCSDLAIEFSQSLSPEASCIYTYTLSGGLLPTVSCRTFPSGVRCGTSGRNFES